MISDAIDKILSLGRFEMIKDNLLREYIRSGTELIPLMPSLVTPLEINTLEGLIDYYLAELVDRCDEDFMFHIVSPSEVKIHGRLNPSWNTRDTFAVARCSHNKFPFDCHITPEKFISMSHAYFVYNDDMGTLIDNVSHISSDVVITAEDDGVAQVATVKRNIRLQTEKLQNIYSLKPFRTFPDIEQPSENCMLRLHKGDSDSPVNISLIYSQSTKWHVDASVSIQKFLKNKLPEYVTVIR